MTDPPMPIEMRRLTEQASRLWLIPAGAAYAGLLVLTRGFPSRSWDAGIFLSVAGRLLDGDRLYVDVIDNKDPLFYYSYAASLAGGDWRFPFLLEVLWLAIAAITTALLLREIGARRLTAAAGFIAYPLLLTFGVWYASENSLLPGMALVPAIGLLWVRARYAWAGALLAVGLLFKLNVALILVSPIVAFLYLRRPAGSVRDQILRGAAGFAAVAAVAAILLAALGELGGYIDNFVANVSYSRNVLSATGQPGGIAGHLNVIEDSAGRGIYILALGFLVVCAGAIWLLWRHRQNRPSTLDTPPTRALAALLLVGTAATFVTLALTAVWPSHLGMLAFPSMLLIAFLGDTVRVPSESWPRIAAAGAAVCLVVVLLAGSGTQRARGLSISPWTDSGDSATADLLEQAADERFPGSSEVSFAHLGFNDEDAVAAFLDDRFDLACPMIAQYTFTPQEDLGEALDCVRDERPCLVLVTPSFRQKPSVDAPEPWKRFLADGSQLLAGDYELAGSEQFRLEDRLGNPDLSGQIQAYAVKDRAAAACGA